MSRVRVSASHLSHEPSQIRAAIEMLGFVRSADKHGAGEGTASIKSDSWAAGILYESRYCSPAPEAVNVLDDHTVGHTGTSALSRRCGNQSPWRGRSLRDSALSSGVGTR